MTAAGSGPGRELAGTALWLAFPLAVRPGPFDPGWIPALLLLAPLVLVPLGLSLLDRGEPSGPAAGPGGGGSAPARCSARPARLLRLAGRLQLPAAGFLAAAFVIRQGSLAAALALPWLAVAGLLALTGLLRIGRRIRSRGVRPLAPFVADAGLVYLAVGAAWAVADRLGFRPLDFPAIIVVLTAVHFHYAGFVLPVVTSLAARRLGGPVAALAGIGVIAAVPLVAVGITATQLGLGPWLEALAAWVMAAAGVLVAGLHLRLAVGSGAPGTARVLWGMAALSLLGSMVLAALYGARFHLPAVRGLDIAWMQALHGGANAFGFGLCALLGWMRAERGPVAPRVGRPSPAGG
ncbi:MAG: YndJ family transporter [Thermoanaerobaculia bacterium]